MRARTQAGQVPLLTVVEIEKGARGQRVRRWVIIDERGNQLSTTAGYLKTALQWAAYHTVAWELFLASDNTFCR